MGVKNCFSSGSFFILLFSLWLVSMVACAQDTDPPGPAKLTYIPSKIIKNGEIELHCSVENPGKPENLTYEWKRGTHILSEETGSRLIINPVGLDTRGNYTCMALNEAGHGESATVFVDVFAPPAFITSLKYLHVRHLQPSLSLTCRVECFPLCSISWFKGTEQINNKNNPYYDIETTILDSNPATGDFESVESKLIWKVEQWPVHPFIKTTPMQNYTCVSSSNSVGYGVSSGTTLQIEYPPENMTVSRMLVSVVEHEIPENVICKGKSYPPSHYEWRKHTTDELISRTQVVSFVRPVTRDDAGNYICRATNVHGNAETYMFLVVQYAPECILTRGKYKGKQALICTVDANPQEVSFTWNIRSAQDISEEHLNTYQYDILRSVLLLDLEVEGFRSYQCYANNSVGVGNPCEIDITFKNNSSV